MFESVKSDPGEQGQIRAARIFYILAIGNVLGAIFALFQYHILVLKIVAAAISLAFAVLAYVTANGLDAGKRWAKWLGIGLAVLSLLNFPIGTIIGIAALVYLNRAIKSGLLAG
jgi:uncharacterized membrane protein (DUF2068 family)